MIERILPRHVACADTFEDSPDARLFPEEETIVANAVTRGRLEFTTGRACARTALAMLGREPEPILRGAAGQPLWPAGTVGSITHCRGYRGAAVAEIRRVRSIGVDAEPDEPMPTGTFEKISSADERREIRRLGAGHPGVHWDRLLFCVKESVYKAWFQLTGAAVWFTDVGAVIDPVAGVFVARPHGSGTALPGRWLAERGLLLTAVVVPGPDEG
ncbi:4'-phosphopantetheinyl transferase superfamily protein [Sphaerimonospora mesophila]|uniref:4'-phosphopantetheinyl transferase family protein n=1 Tax=Sphaerimonospora mesophila TaxID=37483 RepID=UPI0009F91DD2